MLGRKEENNVSYSIEIDKEFSIGDQQFYAFVEADVWFRDSEDPEPYRLEITKAEVAPLDDENLPLDYEGRTLEKVIVTGHPELTEAIDQALWEEVQRFTEDNLADLARDMRYERDERDL
jgi:hypothetical protein